MELTFPTSVALCSSSSVGR